jgi:hypothetical protein
MFCINNKRNMSYYNLSGMGIPTGIYPMKNGDEK